MIINRSSDNAVKKKKKKSHSKAAQVVVLLYHMVEFQMYMSGLDSAFIIYAEYKSIVFG